MEVGGTLNKQDTQFEIDTVKGDLVNWNIVLRNSPRGWHKKIKCSKKTWRIEGASEKKWQSMGSVSRNSEKTWQKLSQSHQNFGR